MKTPEDIRQKNVVRHADILRLNFVRDPCPFYFRQHHRQGLRSVIMEVLDRQAMENERRGVVADGVRRFPAAVPRKMLRIFRSRFPSPEKALSEIARIQVMVGYLTPRHMAVSEEMLLSYQVEDQWDILLCGLQNFVSGQPLDPWGRLPAVSSDEAATFISRIKRLAVETGLLPDLAGVGNLILTPGGAIVLVDINNISTLRPEASIPLDDKGYPVTDKSVEALCLLESRLLRRPADPAEPFYARFLQPERMRRVAEIEKAFRSRSTT